MVRHAREMVQRGSLGEIRVVQVEYAQERLAEPLERTGQKQAAWRRGITSARLRRRLRARHSSPRCSR